MESLIREMRFIIEDELTQVYIFSEACGDCPLGIQGWHHKTFPSSRSAIDIMKDGIADYLSWPSVVPRTNWLIGVRREFLVEVDSLLSLLVHRHGKYLEEIGENNLATKLYTQARDYQGRKP